MFFFMCSAALLVSCVTTVATSYVARDPNDICERRNYYIKVDGSCDSYIECRDYKPKMKYCPEGLHFDASAKFPLYPCGYPLKVLCQGNDKTQKAQPTNDCPHRYGFFPSPLADKDDCGRYRMCVGGKAMEMVCPIGLAFSPEAASCDWPENVPSCKSDDYLSFKCPPAELDESGNPIVSNHKYTSSCYAFYSCMNGNARLLSCDPGLAFDDEYGVCVDADLVPSCASEEAKLAH